MVGSEVVDWLEARPYCSGRAHAVTLGQRLVDAGFIHHVTHEHPFKDEDLFYRLRPLAPGEMGSQVSLERCFCHSVSCPAHTYTPVTVDHG